MRKIVPLISSATAGLLGILHLPRLWLKLRLKAAGVLPSDYPDIGGGFDTMVLSAIGLDPDKTRKYVATTRPNYVQFERWIMDQPGVRLDTGTIAALNEKIKNYCHDDKIKNGIVAQCGAGDRGVLPYATDLNNLDDWDAFSRALEEESEAERKMIAEENRILAESHPGSHSDENAQRATTTEQEVKTVEGQPAAQVFETAQTMASAAAVA